ncbi:hypothetical protein Hanom_Chr14g01299541 [Helianthus anomalus]
MVNERDDSGEKDSSATGYTTRRLSGYIDGSGCESKECNIVKIIRRINPKAIFPLHSNPNFTILQEL